MSAPMMIEALVAVLLVFTILYCLRLNNSIKTFKGQEKAMKATIAELITATQTAERAIAGLKTTVRDADATLGERLRAAESFSTDIARQITAGESILKRLAQIAQLRPIAMGGAAAAREEKPAVPESQKIAEKAQAFAVRARSRVQGKAA